MSEPRDELKGEVRKLAYLTPEEWSERRGADPIARTINAVFDIIDASPTLDATRAAERTLDVAWRECEAALPDGWRLRRGRWDVHSLGGWHFDASVDAFADVLGGGDANGVSCDVGHADPSQALIEALDSLTAALIEKRSGAES